MLAFDLVLWYQDHMGKSHQDRRRRALQKLRALTFAPLMRGSLVERRRKCGNPSCACATDPAKRHPRLALWVKVHGKVHTLHVRAEDVDSIRERLDAYSQLRELIEELTACEVAELRAKVRERRRSRKRSKGG